MPPLCRQPLPWASKGIFLFIPPLCSTLVHLLHFVMVKMKSSRFQPDLISDKCKCIVISSSRPHLEDENKIIGCVRCLFRWIYGSELSTNASSLTANEKFKINSSVHQLQYTSFHSFISSGQKCVIKMHSV